MEIDCDASGLGCAGAQTIDLLARLQLAALRCGCSLRFGGLSPDLRELALFCGLRLELEGQAEEREDTPGVEEERQLDDPAV
jgi:hypothetical protein